jgi:hypothetical protein
MKYLSSDAVHRKVPFWDNVPIRLPNWGTDSNLLLGYFARITFHQDQAPKVTPQK